MFNPGTLAFLGAQGIYGSGVNQMSQAMTGQPGQPTNWGAVGGGLGGMAFGGIAGALAGRGLSNWASRQVYTKGLGADAKGVLKDYWANTKGAGKAATATGRATAKSILEKGAAEAGAVANAEKLKGLEKLTTGFKGYGAKGMNMLAANPGAATALGALAGASLLGGMLSRKGGSTADQQYASKMQTLQALDAQQQQEDLAALSKVPQIRF